MAADSSSPTNHFRRKHRETLRLLISSPNQLSNGVPTNPRAQIKRRAFVPKESPLLIPNLVISSRRAPKIWEQYPRGPRLQTPTSRRYTPPMGAFGPVYNREGNLLYAVQTSASRSSPGGGAPAESECTLLLRPRGAVYKHHKDHSIAL
jgi:hypothetical protein